MSKLKDVFADIKLRQRNAALRERLIAEGRITPERRANDPGAGTPQSRRRGRLRQKRSILNQTSTV